MAGFPRLGLLRGYRDLAGFSGPVSIAGSFQRSGLGHPRLVQPEQACPVVGYDFRHFPLIAAGRQGDMVVCGLGVTARTLAATRRLQPSSAAVFDRTPLAVVQVV